MQPSHKTKLSCRVDDNFLLCIYTVYLWVLSCGHRNPGWNLFPVHTDFWVLQLMYIRGVRVSGDIRPISGPRSWEISVYATRSAASHRSSLITICTTLLRTINPSTILQRSNHYCHQPCLDDFYESKQSIPSYMKKEQTSMQPKIWLISVQFDSPLAIPCLPLTIPPKP